MANMVNAQRLIMIVVSPFPADFARARSGVKINAVVVLVL
jgi:hypothetical protein